MTKKSILIILAILILGFLLRVYRIASLPMYGDELTMVYDTYSIMKTGMDSTGLHLPITFKMGSGRPGGYIYASIPFIYLFGPTEIGVRSLSILSSLGIIVLMYFLGKKLFDNEKIGIIASFLTSISMWDIYLARGGFEAHFALFLAVLGITSFFYKKYILMAFVFGFTLLTYPTFKLTLPLIFIVLVWYQGQIKNLIKNKLFITSIVILSLFGAIVIRETFNGSEQRFSTINVLSDTEIKAQIIQKINEERNFSTLPDTLKPFFYNKPIEYSRKLLENYINSLSVRFLYLRGDGNPRHNPGEWGMLYLVELPLLFIGLLYLYKENKRILILLTKWIMIVPLATMLVGDPHALRNDFMVVPFILISAFVLSKLSKSFSYGFVICMLIQMVFVLQRVYFLAPVKFTSFWSSDAKKVALQAIQNDVDGRKTVLSTKVDNVEYAYNVYAKVDPNLVISQYGKFPKTFSRVTIVNK